MSDLVTRLRDWEHVYPEDAESAAGSLYILAADEIERLSACVVELKDELGECYAAIDNLTPPKEGVNDD